MPPIYKAAFFYNLNQWQLSNRNAGYSVNMEKFFKENSGQNRVSLLELGGYKFFYEWPIYGLILGGHKK